MNLEEFIPIPHQHRVIHDVFTKFDYEEGTHEVLLSGAVGSAKTVMMAAIAVMYALQYPGACILLGRYSLPELKETLFSAIRDMIPNSLVEGTDYHVTETQARIQFKNKSYIISRTWADKRYKKVRSMEPCAVFLTELTETEHMEYYNEIKMRVGRKKNYPALIVCDSNPDSPSHPVYDYFIKGEKDDPMKHVYYSITQDNPHLPPTYVEELKRTLDPKMAQRMLFGKWIDIAQESIYYAYGEHNDVSREYTIRRDLPVRVCFDFNIGVGKPLSTIAFQHHPESDTIHCFDESTIEGFRTLDMLEELSQRPWWKNSHIIAHGDATGKARSTSSNLSDWQIIDKFLSNDSSLASASVVVGSSNPPIRTRHNLVNAYLMNSLNEVRLFIYPKCKVLKQGLKLTAFKKGSEGAVEDDSKAWQHITTALGYGIHAVNATRERVTRSHDL